MQFTTIVALTFATFATAAPFDILNTTAPIDTVPIGNDVTVDQAADSCGTDYELSCCDKADYSTKASGSAAGILGPLVGDSLNGLGLFDGCSKLDVTAGKYLHRRAPRSTTTSSGSLTKNARHPRGRCLGPSQQPVQADRCLLPALRLVSGKQNHHLSPSSIECLSNIVLPERPCQRRPPLHRSRWPAVNARSLLSI